MKGNEKNTNTSRSEMNVSRSGLKRANLTSHYFRKAYDNDSKVVYVNSLLPCEIFWALDIIPFNLGTIGGILAQGKSPTKFINLAEQNHYPGDLCSTSRCLLGAALSNALPTPDFIAITSAPCDVGTNIYYYLSQLYKKEWFLLDVSYYYNDETTAYLENQIKNMVAAIEKTFNIKLEPEKLKTAANYSNEAAAYLLKINELAKMIPSPISVMEAMEIASCLHLLGTKELIEVYKESYEEISKKVQDKKYSGNRKPRVLWHGLRPYYSNEIFLHLESNCNLEIISEINVNKSSASDLGLIDPAEPFQNLAKKLAVMIDGFSLNFDAVSQLIDKIKGYSIDGVISFNSRGCRHLLGNSHIIRDTFNKNDLPYLEIDGDYIDDRDFSFEQIKTRIDAFAELLHGKIGG